MPTNTNVRFEDQIFVLMVMCRVVRPLFRSAPDDISHIKPVDFYPNPRCLLRPKMVSKLGREKVKLQLDNTIAALYLRPFCKLLVNVSLSSTSSMEKGFPRYPELANLCLETFISMFAV